MNGNGGFNTHLPMFDGKNWSRWSTQMRVLFGAQDVLELVKDGIPGLVNNPTDAQRNAHRDVKKRDQKALLYIHQCVDAKVFEKISEATMAKVAWDTLVRCYGGDATVKKVKLQALRKQYENLQMQNKEKIADYVSRVITVTNQMKTCGETLSEETIVEKILRSLTPQFDYVVVAIQFSKDTSTMRIDELQGNLEAHEIRVTERGSEKEKASEQALFTQHNKKNDGGSWKGRKAKWQEKNKKKNSGNSSQNQNNSGNSDSSSGKGNSSHNKRGKKKFNKKNIQCYNCDRYGHFADECPGNKGGKSKTEEEALVAEDGDSDSEPVLLMAKIDDSDEDTACMEHKVTSAKDEVTQFTTVNSETDSS